MFYSTTSRQSIGRQYCKTALAENKGLETGGALPCPVLRCFKKGKGKGGQGGGEMGPGEVKALVGEAAWAKHKERAEAHQVGWRGV